jgi:hypothetical protein
MIAPDGAFDDSNAAREGSHFAEVDGYFITVMQVFGGRSSEVDPCEKIG